MNKNQETNFHLPKWNELPNVDLYLDQIVTFINSSLSDLFFLNANNDKKENQILTKTMINNYVKNNIIEAPVKKKYSKMQCAKIFVICILKQVYSMSEIKDLIDIALKYSDIEKAYNTFCTLFEKALFCTNHKQDFDSVDIDSENKYLLKSVLLSCCYKIYAQRAISVAKKS